MAGKLRSIGSTLGRGLAKGLKLGMAVGLVVGLFAAVTASAGLFGALGIMALTALEYGAIGAVIGAGLGTIKGIFTRPVPDAEALINDASSRGADGGASPAIASPSLSPQLAPSGVNPAMAEELRHMMAQMNGQPGAALPAQDNWQARVAQQADGRQR